MRLQTKILVTALLGLSAAVQLPRRPRSIGANGSPLLSQVSDLHRRIGEMDTKLSNVEKMMGQLKRDLLDEVKEIAYSNANASKLQAAAVEQLRAEVVPDNAGRQVATSSLAKVLGYRNATNVSNEAVLSEIKDCTEVKKGLANRYDQVGKEFRAITTRDLDVASSGDTIGVFPLKECGLRCLLRSDSCYGFHVTTKNRCTLFTNATSNWSEKETSEVTVWVRKCGCSRRNCTAAYFPNGQGRSRYRVVTKKMIWAVARKECEKFGGKLVQISSALEHRFVSQLIKKHDSRGRFLTGLYQLPKASNPHEHWVWFPSEDPLGLSSVWKSGEPNDYQGADEARAEIQGENGLFNDVQSSLSGKSVCECFVV